MRRRTRDGLVAGLGVGAFVCGARAARRAEVSGLERQCFEALNSLPASWFPPVWILMQGGSLGGVVALASLAAARGRPRLARQLATAGGSAWLLAKGVKRFVGRARPVTAVDAARVLGRDQSGLGYPSGHAAVATALAVVAVPHLRGHAARAAWVAALGVGPARLYVGAHLPLDVAGGMALGLAVGAATRAAAGTTGRA